MADRRLLEDGSQRLQEDGSFRLLEQQAALDLSLAVTEADDTLSASLALAPINEGVAGGEIRRRRGMPKFPSWQGRDDQALPLHLAARMTEDDDTLDARIETLPWRIKLRNRRAVAALLLH